MNQHQPAISVIIPAHNYATYLTESIGSVLEQTFSDWECIVVDDGSTDDTKSVVAELMKKDNRIVYYFQQKSGPSVARNYGVNAAKGEFIQFLDADDLLEKHKLEKQFQAFQKNPEYDLVYGGVKYFASGNRKELFYSMNLNNDKTWMPETSGKGEKLILSLLKGNIMVISSPLVRKSLFINSEMMDESLYFNEDWELWLRFAMNNAYFYYSDQPDTLALIRVHPSYSKDNFKMFVFGLKVCLDATDKLKAYKYRKILIPKINYHKKIINRKLLEMLKDDKLKAIDAADFVYRVTQLKNYKRYSKRFSKFSYSLNKLFMNPAAIWNKCKSMLIYGS